MTALQKKWFWILAYMLVMYWGGLFIGYMWFDWPVMSISYNLFTGAAIWQLDIVMHFVMAGLAACAAIVDEY